MIVDIIEIPTVIAPERMIINYKRSVVGSLCGSNLTMTTGRDFAVPSGIYRYKIISVWNGVFREHVVITTVPLDKHAIKRGSVPPGIMIPISLKIMMPLHPSVYLFVNGANYFFSQFTRLGNNRVMSTQEVLFQRCVALQYATKEMAAHYKHHQRRLAGLTSGLHVHGIIEDILYIHDDIAQYGDCIMSADFGNNDGIDVLELHALDQGSIDPITWMFLHDVWGTDILLKFLGHQFDPTWWVGYTAQLDTSAYTIQDNSQSFNMLLDNVLDSMYTDIYIEGYANTSEVRFNLKSKYYPVTDKCEQGYLKQYGDWGEVHQQLKRTASRRKQDTLPKDVSYYTLYKNWYEIAMFTFFRSTGEYASVNSCPSVVDLVWHNLSSSALINCDNLYQL